MTLVKVQKEIKQSRPFRSKSSEAVVALLRTTDRLKRYIARVVETKGITIQQYNVLRILRGSHPEPLLTLEVANRMIEQAPGITRLLDRLEAAGLIRRERCSEDRRRVQCWITERGMKIIDELDEPIDQADDVVNTLGSERLQTLIDLLDELRQEL